MVFHETALVPSRERERERELGWEKEYRYVATPKSARLALAHAQHPSALPCPQVRGQLRAIFRHPKRSVPGLRPNPARPVVDGDAAPQPPAAHGARAGPRRPEEVGPGDGTAIGRFHDRGRRRRPVPAGRGVGVACAGGMGGKLQGEGWAPFSDGRDELVLGFRGVGK